MRKFIYLCSHLCVQVPLLPIAVLTVIPLAVCPSWRPWGAADIPILGNPGVGQWIVIIVVAYTIIDTVRALHFRPPHYFLEIASHCCVRFRQASTISIQLRAYFRCLQHRRRCKQYPHRP